MDSDGGDRRWDAARMQKDSTGEQVLWHYWPQHFALIVGEHQDLELVESSRHDVVMDSWMAEKEIAQASDS